MTDLSPSPEQMPAGSAPLLRSFPVLLVVSLIGVFFLYQVGGGLLTYLFAGSLSVTEENVTAFRLVTMVSQLLFILVPSLLLARWSGATMRDVFPMRVPRTMEFLTALLAMLALQRVLEVVMYLQRRIPLPDVVESLLEPIREMLRQMMTLLVRAEGPAELLFVLSVVAIVPAIVEESFFRGLIQHITGRIWSPLWGVVASGVIFGLFHMNPFDAIGLVGLGLFLAYSRYASASLLVPVLLHFFNNGAAVVAMMYGVADQELLVDPSVVEPGPLVVLGQGVVFGIFFWVLFRSYRRLALNARPEALAA